MSCAAQKFREILKNKPVVDPMPFPSVVSNVETSLKFAKSFVGATISSICYVRKIFADDDFEDRQWEDETMKILKGNNNDEAKFLIKKMKGIFDAIEKKYLRQIHFGIYVDPRDPEVVLESYVFTVEYPVDGTTSVSISSPYGNSKLETQKMYRSTKQLLRQIGYMLSHLDPLPAEKTYISLKLLYYDERTPSDYEPPGFNPSDKGEFSFPSGADPGVIAFKGVAGKFHSFKVKCKSVYLDAEMTENNPPEEENEKCSRKRQNSNEQTLASKEQMIDFAVNAVVAAAQQNRQENVVKTSSPCTTYKKSNDEPPDVKKLKENAVGKTDVYTFTKTPLLMAKKSISTGILKKQENC